MAECHQCSGDLGGGKRSGACKVCYTKGVDLCQRCAMWELGPLDAVVDLAAALRKVKASAAVSRQDRGKLSSSVSKIGDEPLACDVFLPAMGEVCAYLKDQLTNADAKLYGEQFKVYACKVLDTFQKLYKTCKYDRMAIQVLLVMHLSSQERVQCRAAKDVNGESSSAGAKMVKRWQTREIAATHLAAHLGEIQAELGKPVRDLVASGAWLLALRSNELELWLKGFKHPTLMAIDLLAAAGGADAAREALEVGLIVYHALTATRARALVKEHWSSKAASFVPKDALGFLSEAHFEKLYGDVEDAKDFSDATRAEIERVWNVLGDLDAKNALPAHPRYPDAGVSAALTTVERQYLQYLPAFDHDEAHKAARTACETVVRDRIIVTLKKYLPAYGAQAWLKPPELALAWTGTPETTGTTKQINVQATQRVGQEIDIVFGKDVVHALKTMTATEAAKIDPFVLGLLTPDDLRAHGRVLELMLSGETGNTRRTARRTAVETALTDSFNTQRQAISWRPDLMDDTGALDPLAMDAFLDDLCLKMKDDFCVDYAFDAGVSKLILANARLDLPFDQKSWFPLKTEEIPYTDLFADCTFGVDVKLATVKAHYEETGGSSPRPAHYMDWRNHKDIWLYDCFAIEQKRRPVFGSLSVQPNLPEPNPNYGGHILFYSRAQLAGRCVFTFGDKQQPRRSMLLLLDTILHGRKKKDGTASQKPAMRQKVVYQLLRRYDAIQDNAGKTPEQIWEITLKGPKVPYPDGDLLLECQIFGKVSTTDAWAFVPAREDGTSASYIAKDHLTNAELAGTMVKLGTVTPGLKVLPYSPSDLRGRVSTTSGEDAWAAHLSEVAE